MNEQKEKSAPVAQIYAVRVRTLDNGYSYGAPFVCGSDQDAVRLVRQSIMKAVEDDPNLDISRGEVVCVASYTLWSEKPVNPITKRDVRRGNYVVANCSEICKDFKKGVKKDDGDQKEENEV